LLIAGGVLTLIISFVTIIKYLFYTKTEVDKKINVLKQESDDMDKLITDKLEHNQALIKEELIDTKDKIFEKLLEAERVQNKSKQEIYDRLSQNKNVFEEYNQHMIEAIGQIRQDEKQTNADFIKLLNALKDELKNDYINRYNDLLKIVGTKTNSTDFDRLETKFDKVSETITELKTIVTMGLDENQKRK